MEQGLYTTCAKISDLQRVDPYQLIVGTLNFNESSHVDFPPLQQTFPHELGYLIGAVNGRAGRQSRSTNDIDVALPT
jgi:hypothetical protein